LSSCTHSAAPAADQGWRVKLKQQNRKCCTGNTLGMARVKLKDVHIVQLHTQCCSGCGSGLKGQAEIYSAKQAVLLRDDQG
jgi:hypothetical protein